MYFNLTWAQLVNAVVSFDFQGTFWRSPDEQEQNLESLMDFIQNGPSEVRGSGDEDGPRSGGANTDKNEEEEEVDPNAVCAEDDDE